jgi:hypothetical protein
MRLSHKQDASLYQQLVNSEGALDHPLVVKPFKWLEPYGISDSAEIETIRQRIVTAVRDQEQQYAATRKKASTKAIGAEELQRAPFMKPHTPKKKDRKIFLICRDTELRLSLLESLRKTMARCRECYQLAKAGLRVEWPPGTFVPWFPPGFVFPLPAT